MYSGITFTSFVKPAYRKSKCKNLSLTNITTYAMHECKTKSLKNKQEYSRNMFAIPSSHASLCSVANLTVRPATRTKSSYGELSVLLINSIA